MQFEMMIFLNLAIYSCLFWVKVGAHHFYTT